MSVGAIAMPKVLPAEVQQHAHVRVVEAVEDEPATAARPNSTRRAQPAKRMRHRGLGTVDGSGKVRHAQLAGFEKGVQDACPRGVAQDPEPLGQAIGLVGGRNELLGDGDSPGIHQPVRDICTHVQMMPQRDVIGNQRSG